MTFNFLTNFQQNFNFTQNPKNIIRLHMTQCIHVLHRRDYDIPKLNHCSEYVFSESADRK